MTTTRSVTMELARETQEFSLQSVPETFRRSVINLVADHVGLICMGALVTGDGLNRYARRFALSAEASESGAWVISAKCKVPVDIASGITAQLAQASGTENTGYGLHPGPLLAHVALSVGQSVGASGNAIIEAMAWGYELGARFHLGKRGEIGFRQFPVVAAAVAAKLLRLSVDDTRVALSTAAELPARAGHFLRPKIRGRVSRLPMGFLQSAFGGVQAALLAQDGFVSIPDEIDQWYEEYDLGALVTGGTARYLDKGLALKRFPASHGCQMVLELVEEWRNAGAFDVASIDRIELTLPHVYTLPHQNENAPTMPVQSIYGTPWATSLVCHGVPPGPAWLEPTVLSNSRYLDLASKVVIVEDPEATRAFGALDLDSVRGTVTMTSGSKILRGERLLGDAWGNTRKPLTVEIIRDKFMTMTAQHLDAKIASELLAQLLKLDEVPDVRVMFDRVLRAT